MIWVAAVGILVVSFLLIFRKKKKQKETKKETKLDALLGCLEKYNHPLFDRHLCSLILDFAQEEKDFRLRRFPLEEQKKGFTMNNDQSYCLATFDGLLFALEYLGSKIQVWNLQTKTWEQNTYVPNACQQMCISAEQRLLFFLTCRGGNVIVKSMSDESYSWIRTIEMKDKGIQNNADWPSQNTMAVNGQYLFVSNLSSPVIAVLSFKGDLLRLIRRPEKCEKIESMACDEKRLLVLGRGKIFEIDIASGKETPSIEIPFVKSQGPLSLSMTRWNILLVGIGYIAVLSRDGKQLFQVIETGGHHMTDACVSSRGQLFLSEYSKPTIRVFS